ncbi:MAG: hypothetical protein IJB68_07460 [Ruminococcus sp.]|nr:hypothetical protein [Ruminococcus sp.]
MSLEQKEKLLQLKAVQQQKIKDKKVSDAKSFIADNIDNFNSKYRFANQDETSQISQILILNGVSYLNYKTSDYSELAVSADIDAQKVWICILSGSEEMLNIFVLGNLSDFLADCDDWDFISSNIVLVNEEISGIITFSNGEFQVKNYDT